MNILLWIILGALSGWIASVVMKINGSQGLLMDIIMGVIGAVVGGFVLNLIGQPGVTGFNLYSFIVSIFGAILVIWLGRIVRGGKPA